MIHWRVKIRNHYDDEDPKYSLSRDGVFNLKTLKYSWEGSRYSGYYYDRSSWLTKSQALDRMKNFVSVKMVLKSGKKIPVDSPYNLNH